jgi:hypothetical protein
MTLILAMANQRHAVLLSDRRLSRNGHPTTEQSNKASVLICVNARMAFGFTGIAETQTFRTDSWIVDTLSMYSEARYDVASIVAWLANKLSLEFNSNSELRRLRPAVRRLSVMGIGYAGPPNDTRYVNVLITNFQDADTRRDALEPWSEFKVWWWRPKRDEPNPTHVQRIGAWQATTLEDIATLRAPLERDAPVEQVIGTGRKSNR